MNEEHRIRQGRVSDGEVDALRAHMRRAQRMAEHMARAAVEACGP